MPETQFSTTGPIAKLDEDRQILWAWASVYEVAGKAIFDLQDDRIDEDDIVEAAHSFISESRKALAMHQGQPIGEFVESLVFTRDLQKALGIDLGKAGWLVGLRVHDKDVWAAVKSGKFRSLSIGGIGLREEVEDV